MRQNTSILMVWTEEGPIDIPAKVTDALVWGLVSQTWFHWDGSVLKHYGKVRIKFDRPLKPVKKPVPKPPKTPKLSPNMIEKVETVQKETKGIRGTLINYEEAPAEVKQGTETIIFTDRGGNEATKEIPAIEVTDPEESEETEGDVEDIEVLYDDIFKPKETDEDKES